ncbi:MAG TPA: hypothetical protein VEU32_12610 [Burkholderiales bacterium]|nr:hypothetical protein [Burkholderiales bacterium]
MGSAVSFWGRGSIRSLIIGLALALGSAAHGAEVNPLGLSFVETKDLRLVYFDPQLSYLAPHAVRTFTNALAFQRRVLGWEPYEKVTVFLKDFSDYGNASASPLPRNTLRFDMAPVSYAFETFSASERLYSIMNHELTHVATTDIASETDRKWRRFFGGKVFPTQPHPETLLYSYLTVPRFTVPRWYAEGSAVFMETWMAGGLGRVQSGFYEMVFRAMVRDHAHFYDPLGLDSRGTRIDFQVGSNAYLYGTRFFTWLAYAYSPEKVIQWLRRDEDSKRHYADQFEHVFGIPLERAWADWIAFERDFQAKNLAQVRTQPITPYRQLVPTAVGSSSRLYYDKGILYGAFDYQGVVAHIGALDTKTGQVRRIVDLKDTLLYKVTGLAWDPASRTLFYSNDNHALRDVMAVNVDTGEVKDLLPDSRIGELVFNPVDRSLLGIRHESALATLVRIPYPYTEWNQIYTFPYGVVPYDLDISPDGRLVSASVAEVSGEQFLKVWELERVLKGEFKPVSEFKFGTSVPESFVFSKDGRSLYGSSYYTGVSNIFRYDVASGDVEAVSNAEAGYFRPVPLDDGKLIVLHYTADGFVPAMIEPKPLKDVSAITFLGAELAEKHPVVKTWQVPAPSTVDDQKLVIDKGAYLPLKRLGVESAYPVLQGYKRKIGIGYHVFIDDPLDLGTLGITAAFTPSQDLPSNERTHVDARYQYLNWHAGAAYNRSDFYDLFGPTIRSRRGFQTDGGYDKALIFDEPRRLDFKSDLAYYHNLDALPAAQNVAATAERLVTAEAGLYYTDTRKSRGAVDDEKGIVANGVFYSNYANDTFSPQLRGGLDFGVPLPLGHSSIWLRNAAGVAHGERSDPYANFFFGGFGNNWVDAHNEKRYRDYYSMPGFDLNELSGRTFARSMLEANLPPVVFESVGTPAFYLAWLRPALFATALWTDPSDSSYRTRYNNVGAQADLRFSVLHWYEMTLSVGYAVGYKGATRSGDEWMVSLKIM